MKKLPYLLITLSFVIFLFGMGLWTLLSPDPTYVVSERRSAAELPPMEKDALLEGDYAQGLEDYFLDSLPPREALRRLKAFFSHSILRQKDEDGIFLTENGVARDLSPLSVSLVENTAKTFDRILATYFPDHENIYLSVIPDKAYYARPVGERLDADALFSLLSQSMQTPHTDIPVANALSLSSYYATDIHWKQEALFPVVTLMGGKMGFTPPDPSDFVEKTLGDFVGALGLQSALTQERDALTLLYDQNGLIASSTVTYPDGKVGSLYDEALFSDGLDPYNVFLRGETVGAVGNFFIKIENPSVKSPRRLILFRDSFARSLVPLLLSSYSEIILVDLRAPTAFYKENAALLWADENTDILFMASVYTLNATEIK